MRGLVPVSLPLDPKPGSLRSDNYHPVVKTSPVHALFPVLTKCASNLVPRVLYLLLTRVREEPGNEVGTPATEILNNKAINKIIKYATYTSPITQLIWPQPPPPPPKKEKFAEPLFFVSPRHYSRPKRNWKQCSCKIFGGQIRRIMGYVQVAYIFEEVMYSPHWPPGFQIHLSVED